MRSIKRIILHCSDTPNGRPDTVEDVRRWHVEGNHWSDIGYHYVIETSGAIRRGRPVHIAGAHARSFNGDSLGICLIGRDRFSKQQWESLRVLVESIELVFSEIGLWGHGDLTGGGKSCPNFNAQRWSLNRLPEKKHILFSTDPPIILDTEGC